MNIYNFLFFVLPLVCISMELATLLKTDQDFGNFIKKLNSEAKSDDYKFEVDSLNQKILSFLRTII